MLQDAKGRRSACTLPAQRRTAYAVFAAVPLRGFEGCSHCHSPATVHRLATTPPRDLAPADVDTLSSSLVLTLGDVAAVRHFAPRPLERLASGGAFEPNHIGLALERGQWTAWSSEQVAATRAVLLAWWTSALTNVRGDVAEATCTIAQCEVGRSPYLEVWALLPPRERSLALLRFVHAMCGELVGGSAPKVFWEGRGDQWDQVRRFATDPERLVEAAAFLPDRGLTVDRDQVSAVLDVLAAR